MDSKVVTTLAEDGTALKETRWSPQVLAFAAAGTTTTIGFRGTGTSDDFLGTSATSNCFIKSKP